MPEFLGVHSDEPGLIYSVSEFSADELFEKHPVDVIVDFSSADGVDYYAEAAAKRGIIVISAISAYPNDKLKLLSDISTNYINGVSIGTIFILLKRKIWFFQIQIHKICGFLQTKFCTTVQPHFYFHQN